MPDRFIYTMDDVLNLLDALLVDRSGQWWDEFFADRSKPCPFFVDWPDENLVAWFGEGLLAPGRLHTLWDAPPFSLLVLRPMNKTDGQGPCFGEDFLWALLAAKESSGGR
jgi:hypothetical protein